MKIVSLLFLLFVSLTLGAQDITGKWYGYPDLKNMRLRLEYHVEKAGGGYQVTLKIPDLSEKTYRADAVELADHVLTVNIADAQTRSILRLQADGSLKGTFLWEGYDLHIFLTVQPTEQLRRIAIRNGQQGLKVFRERWIPLEERYFSAFSVQQRCELCFATD